MAKRRRTKRSFLGTLSVSLASLLIALYATSRPAQPTDWFKGAGRPLILAHQGGDKEWPSNTLYAFEHALQAGSDALDFDLHMTSDRVLVVLHDTTVDRTTDGTGAVAAMTWSEVEKLDAAYDFSLDGKTYPLRGKGIKIPRLEQVLETFPSARLQIEVKETPVEVADVLATVLTKHEAEHRVLLSCFDDAMMAQLRKACPGVASSATPLEIKLIVLASRVHLEKLISPDYCALQIPLSYSGIDLVTARTVQAAHSRGVKVLPWTIDTDSDAEVCRQAGADGLNTNLPTKMERVRENWAELGKPLLSQPDLHQSEP